MIPENTNLLIIQPYFFLFRRKSYTTTWKNISCEEYILNRSSMKEEAQSSGRAGIIEVII